MISFWETKDWIEAKTSSVKTDKLLNRTEYLKMVGWKDYKEEDYLKYLQINQEKENYQEQGETE